MKLRSRILTSYMMITLAWLMLGVAGLMPLNPAVAATKQDRPNLLLSDQDAELYRRIFEAQKQGNMDAADLAIDQLKDKRLLGHVLYQRYLHPTAYTSSFAELSAWLDYYADHPGAEKIYSLALKKAPSAHEKDKLRKPAARKKIRTRAEPTMVFAQPYKKGAQASGYSQKFENEILGLIRKNKKGSAIDRLFKADKGGAVPAYQVDYLKSRVAEDYLYDGRIKMAYELAAQAYNRSGDKVPLAGWVYGLSTWYNGNYAAAAQGFKSAAISDYASGWLQAAASFWAARAYERIGHSYESNLWLTKAQEHPRTFYGLLALQAAGKTPSLNWSTPPLTREMVRAMAHSRATMRALALMDIGRYDWAEQEFLYVDTKDDSVRRAMLAFAQSYDMPELSLRLGSNVRAPKGHFYDAALYPAIDLSGVETGAKDVDSDLLHAIVRQESNFNPYALSRSGAVGMMQIMPDTARYVANRYDLVLGSTKTLLLPSYNLKFGQYYIHDLLGNGIVKDDVVSALIAYNAGPGNLKKWRAVWPDVKDPLLFIELLPVAETRKYVERVLANYWIYRVKHKRGWDQLAPLVAGNSLTYAQITQDLPYKLAQSQ